MKSRHLILSLLFALAVGIGSCTDDGTTDAGDIKPVDSPSLDSTTPAHVQDPSTAYPQPPVTGSQTDSSRSTDSVKKH